MSFMDELLALRDHYVDFFSNLGPPPFPFRLDIDYGLEQV